MAQKQASKRKRRTTALPVLGATGVSLTMAGGASAAVAPTSNGPSQHALPVITLGEEEISDVSLATFFVYERDGARGLIGEKVAARCGGCRGCGGCAARGCARGCAVARCAGVARCAVARCAVGRCAVGVRCAVVRRCGCGVGFGCVGCVGCGGGCGGSCWQWNGWNWVPVC